MRWPFQGNTDGAVILTVFAGIVKENVCQLPEFFIISIYMKCSFDIIGDVFTHVKSQRLKGHKTAIYNKAQVNWCADRRLLS